MRKTCLSLAVCALLAGSMGLVGCAGASGTAATTPVPPQSPILTVATAIANIQAVDKNLTGAVIQANTQGLIDNQTTGAILNVALKVSQAGDQAAAVIQGLTTLPAGTKVSVWTILGPISTAVNNSLATGLIPIKDPATKTAIQTLLTTIQGTLAIVQVQTAGGN